MTLHITSVDPATPRRIIARWAAASGALLLVAAVILGVGRFYGVKFNRTTGDARWLWSHNRIAADEPEAFFLTRELDIPAGPTFVQIRIAADPEYTLWFNGKEIGGGSSDGLTLHRYDVTELARERANRIVIAIRSPRGVGGVLAVVDLGPMLRSWLVTGSDWKLYTRWTPALLSRDLPAMADTPRVLGKPPFGRWNYMKEEAAVPYEESRARRDPVEVTEFDSWLPEIEVKSGVAVAGRKPARARAFDFGRVVGRAAIRVAPGPRRAVFIRYAGEPEHLQMEGAIEAIVVGEGETEVVSPQRRGFRYLIVYDEPAEVWVME